MAAAASARTKRAAATPGSQRRRPSSGILTLSAVSSISGSASSLTVMAGALIPVIGIGGIMTGNDAIEFFLAGASAIQVGTANFVDIQTPLKIIGELTDSNLKW